jgi:hypothetical protein
VNWGEIIVNNAAAALATVIGGLVLFYVRRTLTASQSTEAHVRAESGKGEATRLDVASLQGWARGVDRQLADLQDESTDLAHRAETDRRLSELESFRTDMERLIGRVRTDSLSS